MPKLPVARAHAGPLGLEGDAHRFYLHGGPRKALLLLAREVIDELTTEGWPLFYGALGENITAAGLDWREWRPGQKYRVGNVLIELTTPRAPCSKLNPYGPGIQKRIYDGQVKALDSRSPHWGESGFYAAVLQSGTIAANDTITLVD